MSSGALKKREVAEVISPSPSKQQTVEVEAMPTAESEPSQKKKRYLRNTKFLDLFPTESNKRLQEDQGPNEEGSAAPYVKELWRYLDIPLHPNRQEKVLLKEIKLFLNKTGRIKQIKPKEFKEKMSLEPQKCFEEKDWHFNLSNAVGGTPNYKLLCLGPRGKDDDPITDFCNKVGNSLSADLLYGDFCTRVFKELQWDDTEFEGFKKAIEIKGSCYPEMKALVIPWVLDEWATYNSELNKYYRLIDLHCDLWDKVEEQGKSFFKALFEIKKNKLYAVLDLRRDIVERDFHCIKDYISKRLHELEWGKSVLFQIEEYFEKTKPVTIFRTDKGYHLYVMKKITKAIELGIIKKDGEVYEQVEKFLKKQRTMIP